MLRLETKHTIAGLLGVLAAVVPSAATGQVETTVPDIVAGARPAVAYSGRHTSHVAVRFQDGVLPLFSNTLSFEQRR